LNHYSEASKSELDEFDNLPPTKTNLNINSTLNTTLSTLQVSHCLRKGPAVNNVNPEIHKKEFFGAPQQIQAPPTPNNNQIYRNPVLQA